MMPCILIIHPRLSGLDGILTAHALEVHMYSVFIYNLPVSKLYSFNNKKSQKNLKRSIKSPKQC